MALNKELIEILVCPKCKGDLSLFEDESGFECEKCKVVYPVKDEIPIMLVDEAIPSDRWKQEKK
jgi:hypothetical protein